MYMSTFSRKPHFVPHPFKAGFTLIELMVVIAIIGILMAAGLVAFTNAQKNGRDARRRADIQAMGKAFEQYYNDNNGNYINAQSGAVSTGAGWTARVPAVYFSTGQLPLDPLNNTTYRYQFRSVTTVTGAPNPTRFCVAARLENPNGNCNSVTVTASDNNYADPLFARCEFVTPGTGTSFCVQSVQ
jgi:prepilin-type N-terminal cleavage/methylation domain-containing protein